MYEDLTFGELIEAKRVSENSGVETLSNATVERQSDRMGEELHISNIGEGSVNDLSVDLISGEFETSKDSIHTTAFDYENVEIDATDGEMSITIDRVGETISLVVEYEGEVNDDTGVDLEEFGVGL